MNLTEIEKAVSLLSSKNPGLTKELLRVLLEAAGWEERHIKEAQIIFAAHLSSQSPTPLSSAPGSAASAASMTFITGDGREEGDLTVIETKEVERNLVSLGEAVAQEHRSHSNEVEVSVPSHVKTIAPSNKKEELSLVERGTTVPTQSKTSDDLPEDLPLVPFESSPHVWSFGRYKETFHPDLTMKESIVTEDPSGTKKEELLFSPYTPQKPIPPVVAAVIHSELPKEERVEIDLEKTPITKGDESLVILASVMLLAILLILGYMYANGRL